jgi:hypothetical protein
MELQIILENFNKTYSVGDSITGTIQIKNRRNDLKYNLIIYLQGTYILSNRKSQPPTKIKETFLKKDLKIISEGTLEKSNNPSSIYFKFPLIPESNDNYYESYHGVVISIIYELSCNLQVINSNENYNSDKVKININVPGMGINNNFGCKLVPYYFNLNNKNMENNQLQNKSLPDFNIECFINNINCNFDKPFDGYIIIHNCNVEIKSIELQFLRHEETVINNVNINETSEIQNLQIGDGDVNKNIEIPLFMIFPKTFSCATLNNNKIKISFEMNVMVVLVDGVIIMDNFPVNLWRG